MDFMRFGQNVTSPFEQLLASMMSFLPTLVTAVIVFLIGLMVARMVGSIVRTIIAKTQIDDVFKKMSSLEKLRESGITVKISVICGGLVRWFFILAFLMLTADILGLSQITEFLNSVILYMPNIVVAVVILVIAFLTGNFVFNVVRGSTRAAGVMSAGFLAMLAKWSIIIFGLLAALSQLGVATMLINTMFTGVIGAMALAIGLAFGLGGKEEAAMFLRKMREEMQNTKR